DPGPAGAADDVDHRGRGAQPAAQDPRPPLGQGVPGSPQPGHRGGQAARVRPRRGRVMRILLVTGLSGAGKSTVLRALEDLGYFCVDNLPLPLFERFIDLLNAIKETDQAAIVADAREGEFLSQYREVVRALRAKGHPVEVLYLDAADDVLLRRFSETRRRHPVAGDDLREGMARERKLLQPLRDDAEAVVDTGNLNVHQLKGIIQERYGRNTGKLSVTLLSFGFKHGYPAEADIVLDVRF